MYKLEFIDEQFDGEIYQIIVLNGEEVCVSTGRYEEEILTKMFSFINRVVKWRYYIDVVPTVNDKGGYSNNLYIDNYLLGDGTYCPSLIKVLKKTNIKFTYRTFYFDLGKWFNERIIKLEDTCELEIN